jgi:L-seryl-tRNA(Ser) seleniumtransferase
MSELSRPDPRLRALPQVQRLIDSAGGKELCARYSHDAVVAALRAELAAARAAMAAASGPPPSMEALLATAEQALHAGRRPALRRVINATGVVLHTNLGRAPLARCALDAMAEVAAGYANLEFDLAAGGRGGRGGAVEPLLCRLLGAEAALVVNNAAAAVLLALSGLAAGGEVVVSRGELVEIGGGFRIPEVIAQGGARLVEVGATNKTRIDDYRRAVNDRTRVLLKVHQSNYRVVGFTAEAELHELKALAEQHGLLVMHDLGSGALMDFAAFGRGREPTPQESLAAGADLVAFSGDKLLGGPQAGLVVGRRAAIDPLRRHPLVRAMRLDKATLAALEATLRLYLDPPRAVREIPVLRMLAQTESEVAERARRLKAALDPTLAAELAPSEAQVGGGSLPGEGLASASVVVGPPDGGVTDFAARLRQGTPPVVGRLAGGRLVLDLFTVADAEVEALAAQVSRAARP